MSAAGSHAEIEAQVRAAYGAKLQACERLHAFGEDALYAWAERAIDPQSVDPIFVPEGARATRTSAGALRLVAGGFGQRAHAHARRAIEPFKSTACTVSFCGATPSRRPTPPADARSTPELTRWPSV